MTRPPLSKRGKPPRATASTLAALGSDRLAELLLAAAKADPGLKRRLTLEVASDPADLAEEIDKQLERIRTAKGRLNGRRAMLLARDLTLLLDAIVEKLGGLNPPAAAARLLDALSLAPVLLTRRTGEARSLVDAFDGISARLATVLPKVQPAAAQAAAIQDVYRAFLAQDDELAGDLLPVVIPALGPEARAALSRLVEADLGPLEATAKRTPAVVQRIYRLTEVLAQLADAQGDVDAFVAAHRRRDARLRDHIAMAGHLFLAGRAAEAICLLEEAPAGAVTASPPFKALRIQALDILGRRDEAQAERWGLFEATLSVDLLRSYLKRLPDFEDIEREEAALQLAEQHPDTAAAISFLAAWPDHRRAGRLVRARQSRLNGEAVGLLAPAAEALAYRDPLAATLLLRAVIDALLHNSGAGQLGQAGRFLVDASGLAASIENWEGRPDHAAYVQRLKTISGRRAAFWRAAAAGV